VSLILTPGEWMVPEGEATAAVWTADGHVCIAVCKSPNLFWDQNHANALAISQLPLFIADVRFCVERLNAAGFVVPLPMVARLAGVTR
jgi:hypothetical protein